MNRPCVIIQRGMAASTAFPPHSKTLPRASEASEVAARYAVRRQSGAAGALSPHEAGAPSLARAHAVLLALTFSQSTPTFLSAYPASRR